MKEYYLLAPKLLKGLRPTKSEHANTGHAVEARNMVGEEASLNRVIWDDVHLDIMPESWPFPTAHTVTHGYVIMGSAKAYQSWTVIPGTLAGTASSRWSVAEVGDYIVAAAKNNPICATVGDGDWGVITQTDDIITPDEANCVCDFYGQQFVYGGVSDSRFDPSKNVIAWSKPLSPGLGIRNMKTDTGLMKDRRNDGGWLYIQNVGEIFDIKPLGKNLVVFGGSGIAVLSRWQEPGWSSQMISDVGVSCKGAVAGNYSSLWYVDRLGQLWSLTSEGQQNLYYDEFLSGISNPILSFDERRVALYISGENNHYIYKPHLGAMTGPNDFDAQFVGGIETPVIVSQGFNNAITPEDEVPVGDSVYVSDVFDMARSGYKTLRWVQLFGDIPDTSTIASEYRYDMNGAFTRMTAIKAPPHNSVHFGATAPEHRVVISSPDDIKLTGMQIRWQAEDRRFIRGGHPSTA